KSSLAFDTLFREGQRRFLESLSTYARQFLTNLRRPEVAHIAGLSPAIAVDQRSLPKSPRSTVGTTSGCLDVLRLLFARLGTRDTEIADGVNAPPLTRSLFSFNSPVGTCPACQGLGVEDRVDPKLLIADPQKSLREGALVPTTPSGYIVYSQVTQDVLGTICAAHGFDLDTPWGDLTDAHREVILYGSRRLKVPFGKHPLASRMRWSGITAKPREEGYYRGIVPIIEEILTRDRNKNALRFARSRPCSACHGTRLNPAALAVHVAGRTIADVTAMSLRDLDTWLDEPLGGEAVVEPLRASLRARLSLLCELGLDHLSLDRATLSLSSGEGRRLRLSTQLLGGLSGLLYVLDEPSAGLHPTEIQKLQETLFALRDQDNTVVVVEHDPDTLRAADWLVEIGPEAGAGGGHIVVSGPPAALLADARCVEESPTLRHLKALQTGQKLRAPENEDGDAATHNANALKATDANTLTIIGANAHYLADVDVTFRLGCLNVICGVSGAGKSTLLRDVLGATLRDRLAGRAGAHEGCEDLHGAEAFTRIVAIDDTPIGRTPRSNAATYTKLFDAIRKRFAAEAEAKYRGLKATAFSFNTKGGRCEACEGAGVRSVGMHFLPNVEVPCELCSGRRFNDEVLAVRVDGRSIDEVLALRVDAARGLFDELPTVTRMLDALAEVGLGYLTLGQPSTTLSGGEAQRIKLATELGRAQRGHTLYLIDEPTTGLHPRDVARLAAVFRALVAAGHTIILAENDLDLLGAHANHIVELGPGAGDAGGRVIATGAPRELARANTKTGRAIAAWASGDATPRDLATKAYTPRTLDNEASEATEAPPQATAITLRGVRTHTLKSIDVDFPLEGLTVVTGLSGSGKSSLAFDTLAAEAQGRFTETLSAHARRFVRRLPRPDVDAARGLRPAIAVGQRPPAKNPRSTVGTMTEIYDIVRLLYARLGKGAPAHRLPLTARHFSFNDELGACPTCGGLGERLRVDPTKLISTPERSLLDGALDSHPRTRHYGERDGQHVATLRAVGETLGIDFSRPYADLDAHAQEIALYGAGEHVFSVRWVYQRGKRSGEHAFEGTWLGFAGLIEEEYERTHQDARGERLEVLLRAKTCPACRGARLAPDLAAVRLGPLSLDELSRLDVDAIHVFFADLALPQAAMAIAKTARREILSRLDALQQVGLSYLSLDRSATSLSDGEARRVRLAAQLGAPLRDVLYVLDEPTVGLHPLDTNNLLRALRNLCHHGNTVVVVDHDPALLRAADHLIELGPGAGDAGGHVIAAGSPNEIATATTETLSAKILRNEDSPRAIFAQRATRESHGAITILDASAHNLQHIDVTFPTGNLVAVSGVSGSGKSSLVFDVLAPSAAARRPIACRTIEGLDDFAQILRVDAIPLGRTPASTPASVLGLIDDLRKVFGKSDAARDAGLPPAAFSPNSPAGRCPACKGLGATRHHLDFFADVWVPCERCHGSRFKDEVLTVRLRDHTIADVLALTASAVQALFADLPRVCRPLALLERVGLAYLTLGQAVTTLSGGELQRLKLARELANAEKQGARKSGATLYLLDEPTAGLHPRDVDRLADVLDALVDTGNTVVVVDHDLGLLARTDWIIDLGPGGGPHGGDLIAEGPPKTIAACDTSATGQALRQR
ncbi:MAG: excinuclease ABC subunit UvrA, partial [Deltaproteobacteria bacterium]|nr:excinuclease ABC subunit UvrA [Deltaproteobacteria bacterium]